jgi:hypothetical protein
VSVLAKLRRLKCSGVGSREATNVNSTLGGTSTAAGGADALAFGGSDAAIGEYRSLNYCSNIFSSIYRNAIYVRPLFFASMVIVNVACRPSLACIFKL